MKQACGSFYVLCCFPLCSLRERRECLERSNDIFNETQRTTKTTAQSSVNYHSGTVSKQQLQIISLQSKQNKFMVLNGEGPKKGELQCLFFINARNCASYFEKADDSISEA